MTAAPPTLEATLLPGARELLRLHAEELPQRDDLCGAFCAALALRTAGLVGFESEPIDQDAVASAAGSVIGACPDPQHLPHGERGRRDYRLALPSTADTAVSGTTAAGVVDAIEQLSGGVIAAIPYSGPWTAATLGGLWELAAAAARPATLIANLATQHLWGGNARIEQLLGYLCEGETKGPPPDWRVGHFVCVVGRVKGPRGALFIVADTYPALGSGGVHAQPAERLAAAIERRDIPAGGVIAVLAAGDAARVRAGARELGLREGVWDNGSVAAGALA